MVQVTRIWAHGGERVRRAHRALRLVRHFQRMDMQVHDRGMRLDGLLVGQRNGAVAYLQRLENIRVLRRQPGLDVPQAPGCPHDQRLDEKRHHVLVVWIAMVNTAHFGRVVIVPTIEFLRWDRMRLLNPAGYRLDQ